MPMPKKAIEYVIRRQEQFDEDIRKRDSPDYQKKRLIFVPVSFQYVHIYNYTLYVFLLSLLHKVA